MSNNVVIGQSGGPTAVINQSLVGCVEGLLGSSKVGKIFGARHGVAGIIKKDFVELQDATQDKLNRVAETPSAALGSSRMKPKEPDCEQIFQSFKDTGVGYFFYIGGNDSSDTCRIVNDMAKQSGYELRAFHIPKTIDNDLMENDHTPGFGSAAKFVACAFMGDNLDNRALPGIKIDVVMGRHAGFLTAASSLARQREDDGPHLIYVPEVAFDVDKFLADVDRTYTQRGRCLIAVSEGIQDAEGKAIAVKLAEDLDLPVERDSHGNVQLSGTGALGDFLAQLVKRHMDGARVRADTFGYLQRSFAGFASNVDQREARGSARKAAEVALAGDLTEGSITIKRVSDDPYEVAYEVEPIEKIAALTKHLPEEYIVDDCDIADSFRAYAGPIIGDLPVTDVF